MGEDMPQKLQTSGKVEAIRDPLIQSRTDIHNITDLLVSILHQDLFLVQSTDRDHDRVGSVIVQVMIDGRALDTAEVGDQDR